MKKNIIKIVLMVFLLSIPLVTFYTGCSDSEETAGSRIYYCPMHPEVQSDKPGVCPICHMDLVLKGNGEDDMAEHSDDLLQLSDRRQALANVKTTTVKSENLVKEITSYSYIDFAEQNRRIITARFSGRIEKLYVDRTGEKVNRGDRLFEIYSPDLVQAQNDYLLARNNFGNLNISGGKERNSSLIEASRQKLLIMGISEAQINEIEESGKVNYSLTYYSPFSGTVIDKKVQEGMYVNEGTTIYDIADLSVLWSISEIFSDDLGLIKEGGKVELNLQAYPGEVFEGKVDFIYPVVNSETRTVKIRSVFPNTGNLLKPNMYGEAVFRVNLGKGLVIPSEAVIFTGSRNIVWVQTEPGKFQMRDVKTGHKFNNMFSVVSGLKEGDIIVSEGGYLIDSESQLRSGTSATGHEGHQDNQDSSGKEEGASFEGKDHSDNHTGEVAQKKIFNDVCPVLGNKVNSSVTVEYNGKIIAFCCAGCDQEFLADPEKYLKNLSADGKKFNPKS